MILTKKKAKPNNKTSKEKKPSLKKKQKNKQDKEKQLVHDYTTHNKEEYNISYKHRIILSKGQKPLINQCLGNNRFVFNQCLEYYNTSKEDGTYITESEMDTYVREELVSKHKWLEKAPSQTYQQFRIDLYKAINNHKKYDKGYPKFKSRNDTESIRFPQPKVDCKLYENHIKIPKMKTLIRVINSYSTTVKQENHKNQKNKKGTKLEHGLYSGELRNITLIREKDGNYYISINCKVKTILTDYDKQQANKHRTTKLAELKELSQENKLTLQEKKQLKEQYYLEDTNKLLISLDPGVVNTLTSNHNETFNTIPDKITEPLLYAKYMKEKDSIIRLE